MPIAVLNPSSLYAIKPINHLTHQDIVEQLITWIERIWPILTALCRVMWLDISCDLLAPTVRWAWIHAGYKSTCTPRPAVRVLKSVYMLYVLLYSYLGAMTPPQVISIAPWLIKNTQEQTRAHKSHKAIAIVILQYVEVSASQKIAKTKNLE
jgi:hypothetical protein